MQNPDVRNAALVALTSAGALAALFLVAGEACGTLFLPLYRFEIEAIFPFVDIQHLLIDTSGSERLITLQVIFNSPYYVGMNRLAAGTAVSSSTLLGHAFQPLVILLPLVGAAGAIVPTSKKRLVTGAAFSLVLLTALDVPFVLVGAIEDILFNQFAPGNPPSLTMRWLYFLNGGGRWGLSVAAAIVTVAVASSASVNLNHKRLSLKPEGLKNE